MTLFELYDLYDLYDLDLSHLYTLAEIFCLTDSLSS